VWESARSLEDNISWLNSLAPRSGLPRTPLAELSRAINQILDSVGESYDIRDRRGRPAARAFFAAREDAISGARSLADDLTIEVTREILDRTGRARGTNLLLDAIRYGLPVKIGFGSAAAFANPARRSGRAAKLTTNLR
jgi:hypothetical protein